MPRRLKDIVIFIVGPTAVGKTRLSIKLARRIRGEIISCDSMQVYRGMRILSQAPLISEKKGVNYHLVGFFDPKKEFSVAVFLRMAVKKIRSVIKSKKVPIVVGGSGLYAKALIDGLFPSPKGDSRFRKRMQAFASRYGKTALHKRLSKIDPDAAKKIHPNDSRRIIRALEVYNSTGKTITELKNKTKGLKDKYDIRIFGLTMPREDVYSNIDARVDKMFKDGAVEEVERLKEKVLSKTAKAVLGFKEIFGYLKGEYDLDEAGRLLKRNTRRFAKRQLTWFRSDERIKWFDLSRIKDEEVIRRIAGEVG